MQRKFSNQTLKSIVKKISHSLLSSGYQATQNMQAQRQGIKLAKSNVYTLNDMFEQTFKAIRDFLLIDISQLRNYPQAQGLKSTFLAKSTCRPLNVN